MATVNVYVPEEMKERLEGSGVNLSASARECWERDLAIAELPVGDVQVEAHDDDGPVELRFQGTLVARSGVDGTELYLTDEDDLVYVPADEETYWTRRSIRLRRRGPAQGLRQGQRGLRDRGRRARS